LKIIITVSLHMNDLPVEIITYILDFIPIIGVPKLLLVCSLWNQITLYSAMYTLLRSHYDNCQMLPQLTSAFTSRKILKFRQKISRLILRSPTNGIIGLKDEH